MHVRSAHALRQRAGQQSSVLNIDPRAPESDAYIRISGGVDLAWQLVRHVWNDWTLNVHTNGHNPKSWAIALACAVTGQFGDGGTLTLHSGMTPAYLRNAQPWMRRGIRLACLMYGRVICVNEAIATALGELGIPSDHIEVSPAFVPISPARTEAPPQIEAFLEERFPVLSAAMFLRPEYGFELLLEAVERLKNRYPRLGCLVMGACEAETPAFRAGGAALLTGDLDHELCLSLIGRSNVFVRPTFEDGDSISVREAVALGVPVVASNVGFRPPGVLLFEAGDAAGLTASLERAISMPLRER